MWVCTTFGMFMPALRPPGTVPAGDSRLLQIRSRRQIDLTRLRSMYLPELGETIQLPFTDYEYRAYCTHEQWASALSRIAMDMDYIKFKEQAEKRFNDHELHKAYTSMWSTIFKILSTKKHRDTYWGRFYPAKSQKGGKNRQSDQPVLPSIDWSDVPGAQHWDAEQFLIDAVPQAWDDEIPKVIRRPNGDIDHSHCDHVNTAGARRRCRRRNNHR